MKPVRSTVTRALPHGARVEACDNSGAKLTKIIAVKNLKTVKSRKPAAGVGHLVFVSVVKGKKDIRKQVVPAVIVRQKKSYRRPDGMRVKFEDNALVILKDNQGNPKGTIFKGPIAKEVANRWPAVAKIAKIIV